MKKMTNNKIIFIKALIGIFVIFGIFTIVSFLGVKTVLAAPNCTIPSASNRTIVQFSGGIFSSAGFERSQSVVNTSLPAGTYRVTLYAYDEYNERVNMNQPNERYYVKLMNGSTLIASSNSTSDLQDRVRSAQITQVVNNTLSVSSNITTVIAAHAVYPDTSSPNSLRPGCAAFDFIAPPVQPLTGSCSASPASVSVGDRVYWTATASGGTGAYTYSWTGTDGLVNYSQNTSRLYSTAGTKYATVIISSGGRSVSANCSALVNNDEVNENLVVSCSTNRSSVDVDEDVIWRATASGGDGVYDYEWTGTDGLDGDSRSITWSYDDGGTKRGRITVTSDGQTAYASCIVRVDEDEIVNDDLNVSCYASPVTSQVGSRINWNVRVSGGDGNYDYDWSGTDGLNSTSRTPSKIYSTPGSKRATVTVIDGDGLEDSATCNANINSVLAFNQTYQPPMASAVYLSQIPYTGIADNYKLILFLSILALFSVWIAYAVTSYQKNNEVKS